MKMSNFAQTKPNLSNNQDSAMQEIITLDIEQEEERILDRP